ncbi:MAG: hypothetical protein KF725_00620 [Cyclobacteriaceae bacterium]|nr:hypothetical protein [Cyclobacteriaceae bacterium]UYN87035.1 MAG: hypothetical protein KIT51_01785 [Cyclobacteriaceae bacterium]
MKRNSILSVLASVMMLASLNFIITSCSDDDLGAAPTVSVTPATLQDIPGASVSFEAAVTAPNGGQALVFSGVSIASVALNGQSTQTVTVNYTIPANAVIGSTILIVVTAVDNSGLNSLPATVTITVGDPKPVVVVQGNISATNNNWVATNRYLLRGKVVVPNGVTLTIAPGTIIFGEKETEGTLIVNRGGKLNAVGTAANPIVFTSNAPKGFRNRGDWGGVVLLGRDYNSNGANALIEGLAGGAGSQDGLYGPGDGAAIPNDDSGKLKYARIEFAGIDLSQDNELNSLTMGSVGSATEIDHIVVSFANDDAYEWFGGSNDHKYLIAYSTLDDDFDSDRGYIGRVQYGAIIREASIADISGSRAWESSSNSNNPAPTIGGVTRQSKPIFANVTVWGPLLFRPANQIDGFYRAAVEVNSFSQVEIYNSIITGFPTSANFATAGSTVINNIFAANGGGQTATGANVPANFASGNTFEANVTTIFGAFPSGSVYSFTSLPINQAATSPYIAGAPAIPAASNVGNFFTTESFYGAWGTSPGAGWNFNAGWINLNPNNADY